MARIYNFSAGPSTLPVPALEKAQKEFLEYKNTGMSVMEMSHRSKDYEAIHANTKNLMCELIGIPSNYHIIFLGGGASLQFGMIPMNFLAEGSGDFIDTGEWSSKAIKEVKIQGKKYNLAASTKAENYCRIPKQSELKLDPNARFVHVTTNNTIFGTQWRKLPDTGNVPMICDMSSDILSKPIDITNIGMIYAGAQKNLGPAGVTVAIIRDDMLKYVPDNIPTMLSYKTHVDKDSLYNTPPTFPIYIIMLVLEWIKEIGGVKKIEEMNQQKYDLLYGMLDKYPDYYKGTTEKESRSYMTPTFRMRTEELEKEFISEAGKAKISGIKGHRSVGGIRTSMYNAMTVEGIKVLTEFMEDFKTRHP